MLGIVPNFSYAEETIPIPPGSVLVAYSDGVTEARNREGEHYELDRLVHTIKSHHRLSSNDLIGRIIADVQQFVADEPQSDDITLMVVKREG